MFGQKVRAWLCGAFALHVIPVSVPCVLLCRLALCNATRFAPWAQAWVTLKHGRWHSALCMVEVAADSTVPWLQPQPVFSQSQTESMAWTLQVSILQQSLVAVVVCLAGQGSRTT